MIVVDRLTVRVGGFAVTDLSFTVVGGRYAVLMGRTGSGKTTLLEALCGLKPVRSGRIVLGGLDVTHLKPADRGVGYVPQDLALFPTLTVGQHLAFALRVRRQEEAAVRQRVGELAELLGLTALLDRRPTGLSGGEAQRVALGRALSFRPRILLLDEPLSALDEETREEMYALLRSVQQLTGVTTLHVTHSLTEARRLGDRLLRLEDGTIREVGDPREGDHVTRANSPFPAGEEGDRGRHP
jgi:ABC-type sugar transport system ATPase subunit